MDEKLLKGMMMIKGYSVSQMVQAMNQEGIKISKSSFYKKMRGETEFTLNEIRAITEIAGFSNDEMYQIFFRELVS